MRKLIDDDGNGRSKNLGADVDLLIKSSRNVPKNSSFLKRDLVSHLKLILVKLQWGLEYRTSSVLGWSIVVRFSPNHSKSEHSKWQL